MPNRREAVRWWVRSDLWRSSASPTPRAATQTEEEQGRFLFLLTGLSDRNQLLFCLLAFLRDVSYPEVLLLPKSVFIFTRTPCLSALEGPLSSSGGSQR